MKENYRGLKNFRDLDLSVEYEFFSSADRHLFNIADYFIYQDRTYFFDVYKDPNTGKFIQYKVTNYKE